MVMDSWGLCCLRIKVVLTWHLLLLRFLTKFTYRVWLRQGWASSVIHCPAFHVVYPSANSHDRTQKASDGNGSFKCNDKRNHAFWSLPVGSYGVNNRWYPVNDTEPAHFCFKDHSKSQLLHSIGRHMLWCM